MTARPDPATQNTYGTYRRRQDRRSSDRRMLTTLLDSISNQVAGGQREPRGGYRFSQRLELEEQGEVFEADPMAVNAEGDQIVEFVRTGNQAWGGHANGRIPTEELVDVGGGHMLRSDVASAWEAMVAAASRDGVTLTLSSAYRSYNDPDAQPGRSQWDIYHDPERTSAAARPGRSNHGWGVSIDVAGDAARAWVQQNGQAFGFLWPQWARARGTSSFEPWHFNYIGAYREPGISSSEPSTPSVGLPPPVKPGGGPQ